MEGESELPPERRPRRYRIALVLLAVVAILLAALWLVRKPLATRYADDFLAARHVPARYSIADLGFGRQRLVNVVLGDPAHPDLVADWLEARTAIGLGGPYLTGVRGGHVRVRARWVDGRLSLGSIDRLLPPGPAGKPFALPPLTLDVQDLRGRVETPWGVVGARLAGSGALDDGFDGRLAVTASGLPQGCTATAPGAVLRVRTFAATPGTTARVRLDGSTEASDLACAGVRAAYANANGGGEITLGPTLGWSAAVDLAAQSLRHRAAAAQRLAGRVEFVGNKRATSGTMDITAQRYAMATVSGERARLGGHYTVGVGGVRLENATLDLPHNRASIVLAAPDMSGAPVGPLADALVRATTAAARSFSLGAQFSANIANGRADVAMSKIFAGSASGVRAALTGSTTHYRWPEGGLQLGGVWAMGGGGMPDLDIAFAKARPGAPVTGRATLRRPFAANGASLALEPVRFSVAPDATISVQTVATLSGPLASGRVEALTLPIDARGRGGSVTLSGGCVPATWQRIALSGLVLDPGAVRLCSGSAALVSVANGRIAGGATLGATRLTGRLGTTPLALAATGASLQLAGQRFAVTGIAARLGPSARLTTLTAASLDGAFGPAGVAGRLAGAGGKIGAVPLVMADGAGDWRFAHGALSVTGGLTVSDAQTQRPRVRPLPVRDATLTLRDNAIVASGTVQSPNAARTVATVRLTHDLARGSGGARFTVPGLVFDKALQPDQLTPVTFGVIADVRGTVTGEGAIDWTPAGVTSTGSFTTEGTDLAAAFGPVQGIAGTIRFTDLLALESAPGQRATVRSVNPGIPVTDGLVTFRTLANARVQVEGARWPFAGGTLTLDPTLLDFGQEAQRRMTFRVEGAAADQFLQQFDFKNLDATGTFDGVLPMVFDASGGRIEDGRLQVRPGGGTIAYVGEISQKDVGIWGNLAFQALKSLRYRSLAIVMNGPLAGEMVTEVRFSGISQGAGAARGGITGLLVGRLQRLPFVFNIRIKAPFRGLLDATASFYDPRRLIQRNLPQLIEEQNRRASPPAKPIQPPASETVP